MNFEQLRDKHPQLIYEGFDILLESGNLKITFDFLLTPAIRFIPEVILSNVSKERLDKIDSKILENLVFNLGMIELLSYWKATCSPQIIIRAGYLTDDQINWWNNLLVRGLGEFFYTNKIDFTQKDLVQFVILSETKDINKLDSSPPEADQNDRTELKDRDLILVGGGKDSAVTLDSISKSGKQFNCLMLNPTKAAQNISKLGGCKNPIIIKRTIDPKLLELNKNGYLNGHTPYSAYLAFLSTLAAVLYDFKNIIVSNEASSDEANIEWNGNQINHQYSKTSEFEKDFRVYCEKYLAPTNYYSFLRSLGELEISELFSKMEKYHKVFRSCNRGSKLGVWCGRCPKCVSTYLTLYPFLGEKTEEIFGKDLLEDESLITVVESLLSKKMVKQFECVATRDEIKTAIALGIERTKKDGQKIPRVFQRFEHEIKRS